MRPDGTILQAPGFDAATGQHEAMRKLRAAGSSGRLEFVGWMA
jgi:hypothetical protein